MRLVSLRQSRRVSLAACVLLGAASLVTSANAQEAEGESEARQETVVVQGRRVSAKEKPPTLSPSRGMNCSPRRAAFPD